MKKQVLFVAMSLVAVAAWGQDSGTCGESTTWRMGNGEVLFIEGTGATDDYTGSTDANRPWNTQNIWGVVVQDGVTRVGNYAFDGSANVYRDLNVHWMVFPASTESIGHHLVDYYNYDDALEALYITATEPPTISSYSFSDVVCYVPAASLEKYQSNNNWKNAALQAMPTSGTLGDNKNITWSYADGTLTLDGTGIVPAWFDSDAGSYYGAATPAPWAGYYPYITHIVLGSDITGLEQYSLANCPALEHLTLEGQTPPELLSSISNVFTNTNTSKLTVSVPSTAIPAYEKSSFASLGTIEAIPGSEATGSCGESLTWTLDKGTLTISGTGAMTEWNSEGEVSWYPYRNGISRVVLPAGLTSIGAYAFAGIDIHYTDIEVPADNQLVSAHHNSFWGVRFPYNEVIYFGNLCYGMAFPAQHSSSTEARYAATSVILREGTTFVMDSAFCAAPVKEPGKTTTYNPLEAVEYLVIPRTVTTLAEKAFYGLEGLPVVTVPESVAQVGDSAFAGCEGLDRITWMPASCSLGQGVFHLELGEVEFGKSVRQVPAGMFAGNTGMSSVAIPHEVTAIGDRAFYRCTGLSQVAIGAGVTTLGELVFAGCTELTNILCYAVEPPAAPAYCFLDVPITASVQIPCGCIPAYEAAAEWEYFWSFTEIIAYTATGYSSNDEWGTVSVEQTCAEATFRAEPVDGCRFVQWSDGSVDNPRVIPLSADVELVAEFRAETTGIESVWGDGTEVYTHDHTLHIRGNDREATVYDTTGRIVYRGMERAIALDRGGLYIVEIDGKRTKVVM